MIIIDGAAGEGGGQVLRSALGLSLVTGRPFTIENIRGRRKSPGLLRQHLTAVKAACEIGLTESRGAELGSRRLVFAPQGARPGSYHWAVGSAGSCTLVLQTVLPALMVAAGPSDIVIEGGTHNPMAPPFDFLEKSFLPLLARQGVKVAIELLRPGFYPAGGGRIRVRVEPAVKLVGFTLVERGPTQLRAEALCAELPAHIGLRELEVCRAGLNLMEEETQLVQLQRHGPGNVLTVFARSAQLTETFTGFGMKGVKAEEVAASLVKQVCSYLKSSAPVGHHLADQLLIPLALAGGGRFCTTEPSLHTKTNIEVIRQFLDIGIDVSRIDQDTWEIRVAT